jgi:hypothetical protein
VRRPGDAGVSGMEKVQLLIVFKLFSRRGRESLEISREALHLSCDFKFERGVCRLGNASPRVPRPGVPAWPFYDHLPVGGKRHWRFLCLKDLRLWLPPMVRLAIVRMPNPLHEDSGNRIHLPCPFDSFALRRLDVAGSVGIGAADRIIPLVDSSLDKKPSV